MLQPSDHSPVIHRGTKTRHCTSGMVSQVKTCKWNTYPTAPVPLSPSTLVELFTNLGRSSKAYIQVLLRDVHSQTFVCSFVHRWSHSLGILGLSAVAAGKPCPWHPCAGSWVSPSVLTLLDTQILNIRRCPNNFLCLFQGKGDGLKKVILRHTPDHTLDLIKCICLYLCFLSVSPP